MIEALDFGRIVVIGDLLLDCYVTGRVERISPEAPVPVLLHSSRRSTPGGAANVALNAASLGCEVALVGLVGTDSPAELLRRSLLENPRIDLSGLVSDPDWTTITKTRVMSGQQQIVRIDEEHVRPFSEETTQKLVASIVRALEGARVLVCSDYAKGVLSDELLQVIFAEAHKRSIPVIVDPKRKDFSAYHGASLITPNRQEMRIATNMPLGNDQEVEQAARKVIGQCGGDVLVTRSEEGMTLVRRDGTVFHAAVRRSEVYDVSGAGDTVVATVAAMLSAGQTLETAIQYATVAASIVVGKVGTAIVTRAELSAVLHQEQRGEGLPVSLAAACEIAAEWRSMGERVVFTNGCFDLLHPGHISLIQQAAALGDRLIVALNSDESVRRLKGSERPFQDQKARAIVIGALKGVDLVVIFEEDTPLETIMAVRPDVLVKGSDYKEDQVIGGDFVKSCGGRVVLVDLVAGRSTTALAQKILGPKKRHRDITEA
ncbi:D-glycero-beta-D-manno-heptose-7-phosphate kinase [Acetobacteraceae bacterium ESL0709]|nr:D-glycero-beta-D-manno-heptose-7-phosphate kinase [Acetobacteraceae bacterium ESL0697]MDF7678503.1 D-glycero-beta-D-manno-heptose-7-phosphate kinase [Acetobacteraceae bacterium ESL0709]